MRLLCDLGRLARTPPEVLFPPNVYNKFQATVEYEACDSMYRAMGNHHFFRAGFIPEVVRAGLDRIPPEHADPEEIAPAIRELMSRRALEKGDGNRWEQHIHYMHKDLFAPADFPSMRHSFTVWAAKRGAHLVAAEGGIGDEHYYKVVRLELGVPVEHRIPYDDYDLPSDAAYFESPNVQGPHQDLSEGLPPSSASPIGRSGDTQYNEYQAGQDELLATPEVGTSSAYSPPSSDAAESWTPAPTKRRRSSTKRPPASPPRDLRITV